MALPALAWLASQNPPPLLLSTVSPPLVIPTTHLPLYMASSNTQITIKQWRGAWVHTACACVVAEEVLCEKAGEPESFQEKMVASAKVLRLGIRVRLRTALGLKLGWEVRPSVRDERSEMGLYDVGPKGVPCQASRRSCGLGALGPDTPTFKDNL